MTEAAWLSLISGLMVLVLLVGGLARRRAALSESLRLGLIWLAIIAVATITVTYGRQLLG
jgi:hypothetical protein